MACAMKNALRQQLDNGMTLVAAPAPGAAVFTAMLVLEAGSRYDPPGGSGLASLVGGLITEGAGDLSSNDIALAVDALGSSLDVITGYETTALIATGLAEHCGASLDLMSVVATIPRLSQRDLTEGVRRQIADLAEDEGQAYTACRRDFMRTVFRGHPRENPVDGTVPSLRSLTTDAARQFHSRNYQPGRAVLAVVGDMETPELLGLAERSFTDWRAEAGPAESPPLPVRQTERRTSIREMSSSQIHMSMGNLSVSRSDPLYYATTVLDAVLGDSAGFGSRLATRLREERGLAYVVESDAAGSAGLEPGVFWAYTATSPANLEPLIDGLMEQLRLIRSEPPTDEEFQCAIAYLKGRDLLEHETTDAVAGRLVHIERHGLGFGFDDRYPAIISEVTREDVLEAARRVIDTDLYSLAMVGPVDATRVAALLP
ncbi:MAG: insulinase family protein [Candidatus Eisenbacteria bacterium]|nr:insulinase family protein [Candidatus Eisenbacteria bacterium]